MVAPSAPGSDGRDGRDFPTPSKVENVSSLATLPARVHGPAAGPVEHSPLSHHYPNDGGREPGEDDAKLGEDDAEAGGDPEEVF